MDPGGAPFARLDHFAARMAGASGDVALDTAALAMSAVLQTRDTDAATATLDDLAAGVAVASLEGVRAHLYDGLGFGGNRQDYDHPRNSLLDVVVTRRRGLPILLATVMIEVGRRAGAPIVGVGMPMHFLVRAADDDDAFVDPFDGVALDRAGVRRRFEELAGGRLPWDERHLRPTPPRLMVVRMLTNLQVSYRRRHDRVGLGLTALMRASVPELAPTVAAELAKAGAVFN